MIKYNFWVGVSLVVFLSACHKPKTTSITGNSPYAATDSTKTVVIEAPTEPVLEEEKKKEVDWLPIQSTDFESVKIRSKVEFNSANLSQDFPVNFQIRKDSLIWVSVSVGLEVGRGIISRDSVILVDRLNKNVYRLDFPSLSKQLGFPLSYDIVQALLLGEIIIPQREQDEVIRQADKTQLIQLEGSLALESWIDLIKGKVVQVMGKHQEVAETLELTYPSFQETTKGLFPAQVLVKIDHPEKTTSQTRIKIEHQKVEFVSRELRFPFNVPRNYTEKSLKPE